MEDEAGMTIEPGPRFWVLMRPVVVEDDVYDPADRDLGFDGVQEANEFLVPMTCMQRPMTLPSSTSRAANRVVVPLRL